MAVRNIYNLKTRNFLLKNICGSVYGVVCFFADKKVYSVLYYFIWNTDKYIQYLHIHVNKYFMVGLNGEKFISLLYSLKIHRLQYFMWSFSEGLILRACPCCVFYWKFVFSNGFNGIKFHISDLCQLCKLYKTFLKKN